MKLTSIIIDDEPLARECIVDYAKEIDFLDIVGSGNNPVDVAKTLHDQQPDLLFLDVHMPKMNGIDFLKLSKDRPMVIITTAYPSYALEGFQLDVLDYLVKPITFNRFFQAVTKARDYKLLLTRKEPTSSTPDYFFVKCGHRYEQIIVDEILYIEALQNYVTIHTTRGKYMTLLTLKQVEENLRDKAFLRVHKSYVVAIRRIETLENNEIAIGEARIPISRQYREDVLQRVIEGKLWKK